MLKEADCTQIEQTELNNSNAFILYQTKMKIKALWKSAIKTIWKCKGHILKENKKCVVEKLIK